MSDPRRPGRLGIRELYAQARRAAWANLSLTLCLGVVKLVGGWTGHSVALVSDSINSFGDALAAGGILLALFWAERPADREHPYGHTRIEAIVASLVALILMVSGFSIGWDTLRAWGQPTERPQAFTIAIAAASLILSEGLYQYSKRIALRTGSKAVLASAWDQRTDALGSLLVLVGLCVVRWGAPQWSGADRLAAIAISAIIIAGGGKLAWDSLQDLMDQQAEPGLLESIRAETLRVPGVEGVEKLFVRKSGLEYLVDIHVEVQPQITVTAGHDIAHAVKARLVQHLVTIKDVMVHIEPAPRASSHDNSTDAR